MALPGEAEFAGTERYQVERRLGAGGMGVVYLALDRESGIRVALKALRYVDPAAILRLKNEFRALADASHPNLVALHELVSAGDQWFFTMDLVDGVDFLAWIRPGASPDAGTEDDIDTLPSPAGSRAVVARLAPPPLDLERLRSSLRQLAEGVHHLHQLGKLHRDIKPSNVLVAREGRVVLLDFGLVTELDRPPVPESSDQQIVGTVAYMAPEQAGAEKAGPAADWYSVGAILYEALTGRVPFVGSPIQVLLDKQKFEPPPPAQIASGVPSDLDALCVDLLRTRPDARPDGRDVLRRLGVDLTGSSGEPSHGSPRSRYAEFVGREPQLDLLDESFAATQNGRASIAFVHGSSGMGKTALVRRFLDQIRALDQAVVLTGRCYERESVPFKALDSLVDALTRYLLRQPRLQAEALLPRDVLALARMFPVLRRIDAVANAPRRAAEAPDQQELRRRAFSALRELFGRIADRRPLLLFIDDLQWGDVDSAALLADLLRPPDPPPLLLIACYRSEDAAASAPLRLLLRAQSGTAGAAEVREIRVEALTPDEATRLARALLAAGGVDAPGLAGSIARESGGSPFFVDELVRYVEVGAAPSLSDAGRAISLDEVVRARLVRLPDAARRLLEVVAVAGGPVPVAAATRAAGLVTGEFPALGTLRAGHLVRTAMIGDREGVETFHDRIREAAVGRLTAVELAERHERLARALEAAGQADPEALCAHYGGAGERGRAAEYAEVAADRAAGALAFERAAALYRRAIELRGPSERQRRALLVRLGDALANGGRGAEAAQAYREAAAEKDGAPVLAAEALELNRRAAEQLLRSGHIDEGLEGIQAVLGALGTPLAPTPKRALLSLVVRRAQVAMRGLGFSERDPSQVSAEELTRIDTCWSVAVGLGMVDTIRGADFQARHLLLALRAGEPYRVARALAAEACFVATAGGRASARASKLVKAAQDIARRLDHPHALGLTSFAAGLAAFLVGNWKSARALSEAAERTFRDRCTGVAWEAANAQLFALWSLFYLGDVLELSRRVPRLMREAEERGDLYAATSFRIGLTNVRHLVADDAEAAQWEVKEVMGRWSRQGFQFQHYLGLLAQAANDLYVGAGPRAHERVVGSWAQLSASLLLRSQGVRIEATHLRGRSALAAAADGAARRVGEAERCAALLARENMAWADALAEALRGGALAARGDREGAAKRLEGAAERFDAADMALYAQAARRRVGVIEGGEPGRARCAQADAWMAGQGIRNPERMAAMLVP